MRVVILNALDWVKEKLVWFFIILTLIWTISALCFQLTMVYLEFSRKTETINQIVDWFNVTFDGRYADNPGNIFYQEPKKIQVGSISNKVVIGALAGNRNLEFGVRNVIEEVLQDKEYELDKQAKLVLTAEIIYLDVLKTQSSLSVLHKNKESVVIRLKGQLLEDGKVKKKAIVEESADEVSMSTLVIDQGGKFNQQNLSSALKKASESLVNKLIE